MSGAQMLRWRVGAQSDRVFDEAGLYVADGPRRRYPRLSRPQILRDSGVRWRVDMRGVPYDAIDNHRERIAQAASGLTGCRAVLAEPEADEDDAAKCWLTIWNSDPLRLTVPLEGWPADRQPRHYQQLVSARTLERGVPLGLLRSGALFHAPLRETHWLIVGQTGFGKSQLVRVKFCHLWALASLAQVDPAVAVPTAHVHLDFKEGVELGPTEAACAVQSSDVHEAADILARVWGEMKRRQRSLKARGLTKLTPEHATPDEPLLHVVMDEAADYFEPWLPADADGDEWKAEQDRLLRRAATFDNLARKCRNVNIVLDMLVQKPLAKTFRSRPHFTFSGAVRTENLPHTQVGLGSIRSGSSEAPHLLGTAEHYKGQTFVEAEGGLLTRLKTFYVADDVLELGARLAAPWVARPDFLTAGYVDVAGIGDEALADEAADAGVQLELPPRPESTKKPTRRGRRGKGRAA